MSNNERLVLCSKYQQNLPGLEQQPFPGDVGKDIYEKVSAKAWAEWLEMQIKVINEYRLDLSDEVQYKQLIDTMLGFLSLGEGEVPEVENPDRGK